MTLEVGSARDEAQRLAALERYGILETPPEATFDLVTAMVASVLNAPQACVSLVARDRVWFKSRVGVDACEVPREPGFCSSLVHGDDEILHIEDARQDPTARNNSLVAGDDGIRFYAGAPLCTPEGHRIGTICAFGPEPRGLSASEASFLAGAATLVMHEIELRRTRHQLARTEKALRQSQRLESIGMIAGGVAHDFNNLLGGILGNAALLGASMGENGPGRHLLNEIETTARRAVTLVGQVFAFAGRGEESPAVPTDLNALIRETWLMLEPSWSNRARVELTLAKDLPPVLGQSIGLRQVVMNLLTNAAEAYGEATGLITVETSAVDDRVEMVVSDQGPGLTASARARIFEPFYSSKRGGRGLGLAIVKRIVDDHGGMVGVESEPGSGAVFRVALPLASAPVSAVDPPTAHDDEEERGTVLVVDDEEFILTLARRCLERVGYRVMLAAGGAEAIDILSSPTCPAQAIVLDWSMPVVSGEDVLEALREQGSSLPVILSSGHPQAYASPAVSRHDVRWAVRKPYTPQQLVETVRDALASTGSRAGAVAH